MDTGMFRDSFHLNERNNMNIISIKNGITPKKNKLDEI